MAPDGINPIIPAAPVHAPCRPAHLWVARGCRLRWFFLLLFYHRATFFCAVSVKAMKIQTAIFSLMTPHGLIGEYICFGEACFDLKCATWEDCLTIMVYCISEVLDSSLLKVKKYLKWGYSSRSPVRKNFEIVYLILHDQFRIIYSFLPCLIQRFTAM
jgi:hypothetical protein